MKAETGVFRFAKAYNNRILRLYKQRGAKRKMHATRTRAKKVVRADGLCLYSRD